MIYLQLFWSFVKIGFTSFGGLSMIPLITSEMSAHHWMTASEISDIVAIAEMTPGPLGLNCATFAGIKATGIAGAVCANLGVLLPSYSLCAVAAIFFNKFKNSHVMQHMLVGIRPACIGMVAGVLVTLALSNYTRTLPGSASAVLNPFAIVISLIDFVLLLRFRWSIPKIILLSAALGILFFGILGW